MFSTSQATVLQQLMSDTASKVAPHIAVPSPLIAFADDTGNAAPSQGSGVTGSQGNTSRHHIKAKIAATVPFHNRGKAQLASLQPDKRE